MECRWNKPEEYPMIASLRSRSENCLVLRMAKNFIGDAVKVCRELC